MKNVYMKRKHTYTVEEILGYKMKQPVTKQGTEQKDRMISSFNLFNFKRG